MAEPRVGGEKCGEKAAVTSVHHHLELQTAKRRIEPRTYMCL